MGAGILAAIGGGLSEGGIGAAVSGSKSGIIYGTGAGYKSGIRAWGGVSWRSTPSAYRADVPVGLPKSRELPVALQRARIPIVRQDIADAIESGVFGTPTGPYRIYQENEEGKVASQQAKARQDAKVRMAGLAGPPPHQVVSCY